MFNAHVACWNPMGFFRGHLCWRPKARARAPIRDLNRPGINSEDKKKDASFISLKRKNLNRQVMAFLHPAPRMARQKKGGEKLSHLAVKTISKSPLSDTLINHPVNFAHQKNTKKKTSNPETLFFPNFPSDKTHHRGSSERWWSWSLSLPATSGTNVSAVFSTHAFFLGEKKLGSPDSKWTDPWCIWTISKTTARPSPIPWALAPTSCKKRGLRKVSSIVALSHKALKGKTIGKMLAPCCG